MWRYPFGSGGKRVITRPSVVPAATSADTISRTKSWDGGFKGSDYQMPATEARKRGNTNFETQGPTAIERPEEEFRASVVLCFRGMHLPLVGRTGSARQHGQDDQRVAAAPGET